VLDWPKLVRFGEYAVDDVFMESKYLSPLVSSSDSREMFEDSAEIAASSGGEGSILGNKDFFFDSI